MIIQAREDLDSGLKITELALGVVRSGQMLGIF